MSVVVNISIFEKWVPFHKDTIYEKVKKTCTIWPELIFLLCFNFISCFSQFSGDIMLICKSSGFA